MKLFLSLITFVLFTVPAMAGNNSKFENDNMLNKSFWSKLSMSEKLLFTKGIILGSAYVVDGNQYEFPIDFHFDVDQKLCLDIFWQDETDNKLYSRREARKISDCARFLGERKLNRFKKDNVDINLVVNEADKLLKLPMTSKLSLQDIIYLSIRRSKGASQNEIEVIIDGITTGNTNNIRYKDVNGNDVSIIFP